jgi:hypothetical protein
MQFFCYVKECCVGSVLDILKEHSAKNSCWTASSREMKTLQSLTALGHHLPCDPLSHPEDLISEEL